MKRALLAAIIFAGMAVGGVTGTPSASADVLGDSQGDDWGSYWEWDGYQDNWYDHPELDFYYGEPMGPCGPGQGC